MRYGLILETDMKELTREIESKMNDEILKKLIEVGDTAIESIRRKMGTEPYQDRTGDLRSSTGFIIYFQGKILHKNFKVHSGGSGNEKEKAMSLGLSIANGEMRSSQGWGIVMVAGMEYASWVEKRGYDVLGSAKDNMATRELAKALVQIGLIE